jgi:type IV secretory pathway VirJ component
MEKAVLIGYSFGAEVLPFLENRLPPDLQDKVELIALLGPGLTADFEFHLTDWLGNLSSKTARPILPEVEKLKEMKILCFYGEEEKESLCKDLTGNLVVQVPFPGGHHFDGDYQDIAERIYGGRQALPPASLRIRPLLSTAAQANSCLTFSRANTGMDRTHHKVNQDAGRVIQKS